MKFNLLNKTSSFLIVLKFRKTYIQIVKIVEKQEEHLQEDKNAHALSTICSVGWNKRERKQRRRRRQQERQKSKRFR